jgi:glycerate-2-kinase
VGPWYFAHRALSRLPPAARLAGKARDWRTGLKLDYSNGVNDNAPGKSGFAADAEAIWRAALAAVEPGRLVRECAVRDGTVVRAGGKAYDLAAYERVFLIAFGKAAGAMASALAGVLGDRLTAGLAVVPEGPVTKAAGVEYAAAAHPIPDERSVAAARRALDIAGRAGEKDIVFVCVSGGGSSLLCLPAEGIALEEKRLVTDALLRAGASIGELNAVRKHLSAVKGGRLARAAFPAEVVTLAVSDVVGDDPGTIASGPTCGDDSTFAAAREILSRYGLWASSPAAVRARIEGGVRGEVGETVKPGDPVLDRAHWLLAGGNMTALRAAKAEAGSRGFETVLLSSSDGGEARKTAANYAAFVAGMACSAASMPYPLCLLAGGELTVTVRGKGRGGRNTEFVLASLIELEKPGLEGLDWLVLSMGTDGIDGPTGAAGAWAGRSTPGRARALGLDPAASLDDNDSYAFFERTGNLVVTGPTGTNVMDLRIFLLRAV